MSAEASAEGLISRSLFTTKKTLGSPQMGPACRLLLPRSPAAEPGGCPADARGTQAPADPDGRLWDLRGAGGVRWDSGPALEAERSLLLAH